MSNLLIASEIGDLSRVKKFISRGINVNIRDDIGRTLLYISSENNRVDCVKYLLKKQAQPDIQEYTEGNTAIIIASYKGFPEVVHHLIKHKAAINLCDKDGRTALYCACSQNKLDIVKVLLRNNADTRIKDTEFGNTALIDSSFRGYTGVVEKLLLAGACVNASDNGGGTALYAASQNNHLSTVKLLLAFKADINKCTIQINDTPLSIAASRGHHVIVQELVDHGGDIEVSRKDKVTPLFMAAENGHSEVVTYLINKGANVNAACVDMNTPLYIAAQNGYNEVATHLINKGANLNAADVKMYTPLHRAAEDGHVEVMSVLIHHGANINACTADHHLTPLYIAAEKNQVAAVSLLITLGSDIECKVSSGHTPLLAACDDNNIQTVRVLLESGANIDTCDNAGNTGLHLASARGHVDLVKLLTSKHAKIVKNNNNATPLDRSKQNNYPNIVKHLQDYLLKSKDVNDTRNVKDHQRSELDKVDNHSPLDQAVIAVMRKIDNLNPGSEIRAVGGKSKPESDEGAVGGKIITSDVWREVQWFGEQVQKTDHVLKTAVVKDLSDKHLLRVAKKLDSGWKIVAGFLGMELSRVQQIAQENEGEVTYAAWNMLITWCGGATGSVSDKRIMLKMAAEEADITEVMDLI